MPEKKKNILVWECINLPSEIKRPCLLCREDRFCYHGENDRQNDVKRFIRQKNKELENRVPQGRSCGEGLNIFPFDRSQGYGASIASRKRRLAAAIYILPFVTEYFSGQQISDCVDQWCPVPRTHTFTSRDDIAAHYIQVPQPGGKAL